MSHPWFADRIAVLATMHRKEQVIGPILETALGLTLEVPGGLDTDQFGTFTRDRHRPNNQKITARLKAERALELTGGDLAIASEGSFGPHPSLPFLACNLELVVLIDRANNLEIYGQELSTETNYSQASISSLAEALAFAQKVGFPEHGLVVMPTASTSAAAEIVKGIVSEAELVRVVNAGLERSQRPQTSPSLHLETDMRALCNPTRMKVIAQAAANLVAAIQKPCPSCGAPGFEPTERQPGLPCALCRAPTLLTRALWSQCQRCGFRQEMLFPDGRETADPAQCPYCNP